MKTKLSLLLLGSWVLCGMPGLVQADVHKGLPTQAVILPADDSGVTKVAFLFDVSGLRSGDNRKIEEALLDWTLTGTSEEEVMEYSAYPVSAAWTEAGVAAGTVPGTSETAVAQWLLRPQPAGKKGAGLVRLDLTELVTAWTEGTQANRGVVVATTALDVQALANQLDKATLTIRYGFRED
jgi:hypothetical protein